MDDSPFVPVPGTSYFRWDSERFYRSLSPAQRRNHDRMRKVWRWQQKIYRMCPWLRWPLIELASVFWVALAEEGPTQTMKPRWGALTFSYLNDGFKPSLWHTYQQVMHPHGEYDGIWVGKQGAPRSKAEADAWREEDDRKSLTADTIAK